MATRPKASYYDNENGHYGNKYTTNYRPSNLDKLFEALSDEAGDNTDTCEAPNKRAEESQRPRAIAANPVVDHPGRREKRKRTLITCLTIYRTKRDTRTKKN